MELRGCVSLRCSIAPIAKELRKQFPFDNFRTLDQYSKYILSRQLCQGSFALFQFIFTLHLQFLESKKFQMKSWTVYQNNNICYSFFIVVLFTFSFVSLLLLFFLTTVKNLGLLLAAGIATILRWRSYQMRNHLYHSSYQSISWRSGWADLILQGNW